MAECEANQCVVAPPRRRRSVPGAAGRVDHRRGGRGGPAGVVDDGVARGVLEVVSGPVVLGASGHRDLLLGPITRLSTPALCLCAAVTTRPSVQ